MPDQRSVVLSLNSILLGRQNRGVKFGDIKFRASNSRELASRDAASLEYGKRGFTHQKFHTVNFTRIPSDIQRSNARAASICQALRAESTGSKRPRPLGV